MQKDSLAGVLSYQEARQSAIDEENLIATKQPLLAAMFTDGVNKSKSRMR